MARPHVPGAPSATTPVDVYYHGGRGDFSRKEPFGTLHELNTLTTDDGESHAYRADTNRWPCKVDNGFHYIHFGNGRRG